MELVDIFEGVLQSLGDIDEESPFLHASIELLFFEAGLLVGGVEFLHYQHINLRFLQT